MASRFDSYSVRAKVIGAFACVLAATLCLGLFSIWRLSVVQFNAAEFRDDWTPGIRAIGEMKFVSMRYRQRQAVYLMLTTDAQRDKERANLDKLKSRFEELYAKFAPTADNDNEHELLQGLKSDWDAYMAVEPDMFQTLHDKGIIAANEYYAVTTAKHTYDKLQALLERYATYHDEGAAKSGTDGQAAYESARLLILAALGIAAMLSFAAGMLLIRSVSTPLNEITGAMGELASGRLDAFVPHADKQDEIGKLAAAMTSFKTQLAAAEKAKAEQTELIVGSIGAGLERLAKGDLTHRIAAALTGPFAKLKEDFNAAMNRLQDTMSNIMSNTHQITNGSGEISQAADDLSRRTEQQAASLEETAAALEEITATVKKTASNAKEARSSVTSAMQSAAEGGQVVGTAIAAMDSISQSSKQIADIIGVIDEIAFQTNLLALNAGVEAARAGDAGRGFAVVASEVRALAQRSSEAAKQIKTLINASGQQVESGVKLVGESGAALRKIVDQVQQINALVTEMAQAAEQQSTGIEQVNSAVSQMDQVTQQNAAMVEESTAASRNLASETQQLQGLVGFFNVGAEMAVRAPAARTPMRTPPRPVAKAAPPRRVAVAGGRRPAAPASGDDWTEF